MKNKVKTIIEKKNINNKYLEIGLSQSVKCHLFNARIRSCTEGNKFPKKQSLSRHLTQGLAISDHVLKE